MMMWVLLIGPAASPQGVYCVLQPSRRHGRERPLARRAAATAPLMRRASRRAKVDDWRPKHGQRRHRLVPESQRQPRGGGLVQVEVVPDAALQRRHHAHQLRGGPAAAGGARARVCAVGTEV
jgi:hypothetical protein